jgi:hypothetical protein
MNDPRDEIRSAARDVCRVLKHINGDGVKQMVVNEETVSPLRCKPLSLSFSVVTKTTSLSIDQSQSRIIPGCVARRINRRTCSGIDIAASR